MIVIPWDKQYVKISFHVLVTLVLFYIFKILIDWTAFTITNLDDVFTGIANFFKKLISLFAPVIIAFIVAYILDPVVDFFQSKYESLTSTKTKKRLAGTLITYVIIIFIVVMAAMFIASRLNQDNSAESVLDTVEDISNGQPYIYESIDNLFISLGFSPRISYYIISFVAQVGEFIKNMSNNMFNIALKIGNAVALLFLSFIIAFYFMKDKDIIKNKFIGISTIFVPKKIYKYMNFVLQSMHNVFSGYIRGQLLDGFIMAILLSIGLSVIGVEFAVAIGIISGFSNIIPYFGSIIGFILAVTAAFFSGEPITALYAAIVVIALQQIDAIFIVPKVVGKSVELSPVMVIISLYIFGKLFGIVGMIFAIPICAVLKIFLLQYIKRK